MSCGQTEQLVARGFEVTRRRQGVPAIVVKGKYLVGTELPDDIQSNEDYFQLLDYLLQKD